MSANKYKKQQEGNNGSKKGALTAFVQSLLDGSILARENVTVLLPFFLYLTGLALLVIFNTYYAEKQARQIEKTRKEVVELRTRYINTKSDLMFLSNQSEIARKLRSQGFIESTEPPRLVEDIDADKNIFYRLFTSR
ncbi:MAG: FtsL-like putative cell division protein [Bacteroidales bacterium]